MRVAILLKNDNFEVLNKYVVNAYAFKVESNVITSVGKEILTLQNINNLLLWLLTKSIEIIFIKKTDNKFVRQIEKVGIKVKWLEDIKDHALLKEFLLT